jgi:protein-tyrosine phosphatase
MSDAPSPAADGSMESQPSHPASPVPATYRVLAVCTGNICRSPALERLWTMTFGPLGRLEVVSAGTDAVVGAPIDGPVAELLEQAGARTSDFAARQLTADLLGSADLVIGFTRRHRAAAVKLVPAAVRRSFTLVELARMLEHLDPAEVDDRVGPMASPGERLETAVRLAQRHRAPAANPQDDDVEDPYGRPQQVYSRVFDQIRTRSETFFAAALR